MATTVLVNNSNRILNNSFLRAAVSSVALDASVLEFFTLPVGFGQLLVESIEGLVTSLSGAYVAPAPAFDGMEFTVQSADASTTIDLLGAVRFVHAGTASARPTLVAQLDLQRRTIVRQNDRFVLSAPVIAGAGVTGTVALYVRGERIQTG